ncbi:Hydroxycinnamoyl-CoA shikimate/quinate hydroxycinnamoyl transferase [Melia azedarach]|uniref:Hydroxycinnamoyl-CoA shikimate/quinate hydroxycinnamoyl transferase n=1 Tax=Melia azedarach TaxID=155640 RepID=A0ACC1XGB3_MELAZ|nr:Hydroxycinnamoyl-CoA shikimate/quinate hydroxycinnamoyl transferase [Melia azedarach]
MTTNVKESTIIRPAQETPKHCLRLSDLDLLVRAVHTSSVFFYRPNDSSNFFDVGLLKESLSKVLVPFYPMAGRFGRDENGRIQIQCNGEGVLFKEAESSCSIDDFGDFTDISKIIDFVPTVDTTKDISSYPILLIQVTHFKCGGVGIGVGLYHTLADAVSKFNFMKSWAEVTRGLPIIISPCFDPTLLSVGVPSSPKFDHIEYQPFPSMKTPSQNPGPISPAILKLSLDQINTLKEIATKDPGSTNKHTRFVIIAAHIWRCMCKARGLPGDQASRLHIPTNGRSRLNPPLPPGFIGNVLFGATSIALSGNIISEPFISTIERIHKAIKRMDDEYVKSALAYLKQFPDPKAFKRSDHTFKCPNLLISNLSLMPIYDADFGWGRPMYVRPLHRSDGTVQIFPTPSNDGSLFVITYLETHQIQLFKKFFYEIFDQPKNPRSRDD